MTVVGWLADEHTPMGGAELTAAEFANAAPEGVTVAPLTPDMVGFGTPVDIYVVHNCVTYDRGIIPALAKRPVVKYVHDVMPHGDPTLRAWLLDNASLVFCSHLHRTAFPWPHTDPGHIVPPAIDLEAFRQAAAEAGPRNDRACWIGHLTNPGKGIDLAVEWAHKHQTHLDVIGDGPLAPRETEFVKHLPGIPPSAVPATLAAYRTHVNLPTALEPFARTTVEAWAAGCHLVYNRLVGACHYLEHNPLALETGARDFWNLVLDRAGA